LLVPQHGSEGFHFVFIRIEVEVLPDSAYIVAKEVCRCEDCVVW
jgi:hypothetical protein